jgi:hypothetical protein
VGSKKRRSAPQDEGVAAMLRRLGEEQIREAATGAGQAEQLVREAFGAEAAAYLSAIAPEYRRETANELFSQMENGVLSPDEAVLWLSIECRHARQRLEREAKAARTRRSRGGKASSAARREPWQPWRQWCDSHPHRGFRKFRSAVVSVLQKRALGPPDEELERKLRVPPNLPEIWGHGGKPPGERTIRQRLFGAK